VSAVEEVLGTYQRAEIPRDRWGRPLITPPGGGEALGYTRASTLGKALEDTTNLTKWKQRMTLLGASTRPDLMLKVSATRGSDTEKRDLDQIAEQAMESAQAGVKAEVGTALHRIAERIDRGEEVDLGQVPAAYRADVEAYLRLTHGVVAWQTIERFLVCDELQVAGTPDGVGRLLVPIFDLPAGVLVIIDRKTGSDLGYAGVSIGAQLAVYAHGAYYDPAGGARTSLGDINQHVGLVIHMPSGTGTATWVRVDLDAGWEAARLAVKIRRMRTEAKRWLTPLTGPAPAPAPATAPPPPTPATAAATVTDEATGLSVDPATGEVTEPDAAAIAMVRQLFAHLGLGGAPEMSAETATTVLTHWSALMADRNAGRGTPGMTAETEMVAHLVDLELIPTPQPPVPAPWLGAEALTEAVAAAPSRQELRRLWWHHQACWDEGLTRLAAARGNLLDAGAAAL
jgi:hypothetical protein